MSVFASLGNSFGGNEPTYSNNSGFNDGQEWQDDDWGEDQSFYAEEPEESWQPPPKPAAKKAAPKQPSLRVNKAAANRLIRHAINKAISINMDVDTSNYGEVSDDDGDAPDPRDEDSRPPTPKKNQSLQSSGRGGGGVMDEHESHQEVYSPKPQFQPQPPPAPKKRSQPTPSQVVPPASTTNKSKPQPKRTLKKPALKEQQYQVPSEPRLIRRSARILVKKNVRQSAFANIAAGGPIWFDGKHKRLASAAKEAKQKKFEELSRRRASPRNLPANTTTASRVETTSPLTPPRGSILIPEASSETLLGVGHRLDIAMSPLATSNVIEPKISNQQPTARTSPSKLPTVTFLVAVPFLTKLPSLR